MDSFRIFPDIRIAAKRGPYSSKFCELGIASFLEACRFVHDLPYGYNSNPDDALIIFSENMGSCTTKHAAIANLAYELELPVHKKLGIYEMDEAIVPGTDKLLGKFKLPFIPMLHCFLVYEHYQVDLTEGNKNGKSRSIERFLYVEQVEPNISQKSEYLIYRNAVNEIVMKLPQFIGIEIKRILQAREEGLKLLRMNLQCS